MNHVEGQPSADQGSGLARREAVHRYFAALQAGDRGALTEVLTPDAVTRWPQTGERMTGAMSCLLIREAYPGGPPAYRLERVSGGDDVWVAEWVADYGDELWFTVSVIEFDGPRIARMTEYYGPRMPAPEWRQALVDREDV